MDSEQFERKLVAILYADIVDRDDIYGEGINIAARLESPAEPGGVCVSEAVRNAVGGKLPLDYEFMGEQKVKNIEEPAEGL